MDPAAPDRSILQAVVEALPQAVVVADRSGRILCANRRSAEAFQLDPSRIAGADIGELASPRQRAATRQLLEDLFAGRDARDAGALVEFQARRGDGTEFPATARLAVAGTTPSVLLAMFGARTDGEDAAKDGFHADGEACRVSLLAAASHDLRQPLQALRLLNGALAEAVDKPEHRDLVAQQALSLESMGRLLDALLDISRIDAGMVRRRDEEIDLAAMLERAGREFSRIAQEASVVLHVVPAPATTRSDPVLLGQVLRNLLANAIKFAPRGEVSIACREEAENAVVEVSDTGVGIAPDELARVFGEFYKLPAPCGGSTDGHGLGLAIVRRLVDLLGIALSVRSRPGEGTQFLLTLPHGGRSATPERGVARQRRPAFDVAHRVLVLEDDPGLRHASQRWLAARGLRVEAAASGSEAIRIAEGGFVPDLVICDLHLADGESGMDALQGLRAAVGRQLPALMLSGDSSEAARATARVEGVCLLLKPVDPDELLAELRRRLDGARA